MLGSRMALAVIAALGMFDGAAMADPMPVISEPKCAGAVAFDAFEPMEIRSAKHMLIHLGRLKEDPITDALAGPDCDAFRNFAASRKLDVTSDLTNDFLRVLASAIDSDPTRSWRPTAEPGSEEVSDVEAVKAAQRALRSLEYPVGGADGVIGAMTRASIMLFQRDNGLRETALLSRNVYDNLRRAARFGAESASRGMVRMYNWPDYIDPNVLEAFEKETKIRVVYEVFGRRDQALEAVSSKSDDYDIVVIDVKNLPQNTKAGNLLALDRGKLDGMKNISEQFLSFMKEFDTGGELHAVPYMWGTVGLAVDEQKVREIVSNVPTDSLQLLFDPSLTSFLTSLDCNLAVIAEPDDVILAVAAYLKIKPGEINAESLKTIERALYAAAPNLTPLDNEKIIDAVSHENYCAALMWSGDALLANGEAAGYGRTIRYVIPPEGGELASDILVIPSHARNVEAAHALMNYLMRPSVAAANTNASSFANWIASSGDLIDPSVKAAIAIPADREVFLSPQFSDEIQSEIDRIWAHAPFRKN